MRKRKIIDLTHTINEDIPVYEGTAPPTLEAACTYESHGFKETLISMFSHTGTHMDSPAHLFKGKTQLDEFDIGQFAGEAFVLDCTDLSEGDKIDYSYIDRVKQKADAAEFILFNTGWSKKWPQDEYFGNFPYPTDEVVDYIIQTKKKGIGIDTIGIDPISDENLTIHKKLLCNNEIIIIENLCNLEKIGEDLFFFVALPLKYKDSDGAPTRAIAVIEND
ncbi:MAG: cyclase family protein [Eubacteriales bacterium]|nr:cyclase family protein [Eubacteriales bacterium]MDD4566255.1 cyclase family protein [Eubacteriales bacterium]